MSYENRVVRARRALAKLDCSLCKMPGEDRFMIATGAVKYVVAGYRYTFTLEDVEEWIEDHIQ